MLFRSSSGDVKRETAKPEVKSGPVVKDEPKIKGEGDPLTSVLKKKKGCSLDDHCLTHFPKLSTCEVCNKAKAIRVYCRRREETENSCPEGSDADDEWELPVPKKFGDCITADHVVTTESINEGRL